MATIKPNRQTIDAARLLGLPVGVFITRAVNMQAENVLYHAQRALADAGIRNDAEIQQRADEKARRAHLKSVNDARKRDLEPRRVPTDGYGVANNQNANRIRCKIYRRKFADKYADTSSDQDITDADITRLRDEAIANAVHSDMTSERIVNLILFRMRCIADRAIHNQRSAA